MATAQRRPRNRLWNRRDPLWFNLFFVLLVVPVAGIIIAPVVIYERACNFVRRCRYVAFDGTEEQLRRAAVRHAPIAYRWFGQSLAVYDLDATLADSSQWHELKSEIRDGDKIWPFTINPYTLAMREGYVVVRRGTPVALIVTAVS